MRDGQEERLSHTFHLTVAPISALDTSFSSLRRPSIAGLHNPRRVQSDTQVPSQFVHVNAFVELWLMLISPPQV